MVSQLEFAVNNIISLSTPGGEGTLLSQGSADPLRKLVNIEIVDGFSINYEGKVTVAVEGISLQAADTVYQAGCFQVTSAPDGGPCYVQSGIWTVALETELSRLNGSTTEYFVSGDLDSAGNVYVIDFGYISPGTNEIIFLERNLSLYSNFKVTSLLEYPNTTKVAVLKRVTPTRVEEVDYAYGEFRTPFFIPRTSGASTLGFNSTDQVTDLEDIAISFLSLFSADTFTVNVNQIVYHTRYQIDSRIDVILTNAISRLIKVIDTSLVRGGVTEFNDKQVTRVGSLPRYLATYLSNSQDYDTSADEAYRNPEISCYEDGCFESGCFATSVNETLINRQVDNRAVAWFSIMLANYIENYSPDTKFIESYNLVIDYLYRQQNNVTGFFYKGWTNTEVYTDSEIVLEEDCSTNVTICLALIKGFEITKNFKYLFEACELYQAIEKEFPNKDLLYVNNLTDEEVTVESVVYQLLLYSVFEDYRSILPVRNWLNSRLNVQSITQQEVVTDSNLVPVTDSGFEVVTTSGETAETITLLEASLFFLTESEQLIADSSYISKLNYLAYSSILLINQKFPIFDTFGIDNKIQNIFNSIAANRELTTLVFSSSYLVNNESIFSMPATVLYAVKYVKNLDYQKTKILDVLKRATPVGFGWLSRTALSNKGNLGQLYRALALPLANLFTKSVYMTEVNSISTMFGVDLNRKGMEMGILRQRREPDSDYRIRLQRAMKRPSNTKLGIEESLTEYDTKAEVKDTYQVMVRTASLEKVVGIDTLGDSYYPGNDFASPNIIRINVEGPIEPEAYKRIRETVPAGVKYTIRELMLFEAGEPPTIDLRLAEDSEGCPAYTTQGNFDFITEGGERICLEDSVLL